MTQDITLMNFKLPVELKAQFEACCKAEYISMSARLNLMIRNHISDHNQKRILEGGYEKNSGPADVFSSTDIEDGSGWETYSEKGDWQ